MKVVYDSEKEVGGIRGWHWIESDTGAWIGPKSDWEQHHYQNILKYVAGGFGTVIQAGGNQGMYPKLLSGIFKDVYTFEPDPLNFEALAANCTAPNIHKFQAGIGDSNGFCNMNRLSMHNTGMHQITKNPSGSIPVFMLDLLFGPTMQVDLIMLDLEQYEIHALYGAASLINRCRPVIFVERPSQGVYEFMNKRRYKAVANSAMDVVFVSS